MLENQIKCVSEDEWASLRDTCWGEAKGVNPKGYETNKRETLCYS